MVARGKGGWFIVGAKGRKAGPYPTFEAAWRAFTGGASESCSDGGCQ